MGLFKFLFASHIIADEEDDDIILGMYDTRRRKKSITALDVVPGCLKPDTAHGNVAGVTLSAMNPNWRTKNELRT